VYQHGFTGLAEGLKAGASTLGNVWLLLILALGISGFLRVLIPKELVSAAIGGESGLRGYLAAWAVGARIPGAPYSVLPIAVSLLSAGAAASDPQRASKPSATLVPAG
jgi:uncharacterized membrane protein YraQ (UPF0718 family)